LGHSTISHFVYSCTVLGTVARFHELWFIFNLHSPHLSYVLLFAQFRVQYRFDRNSAYVIGILSACILESRHDSKHDVTSPTKLERIPNEGRLQLISFDWSQLASRPARVPRLFGTDTTINKLMNNW
jgi:hypothetical protein